MTVLVALFSTAYAPFAGGPEVATDRELAFEELPQVEVNIGPDATLGDVIDRAAEAFGVSLENDYSNPPARVSEVVGGVALHDPDHVPLWHKVFPAIDAQGLVYWARIEDVRLIDLQRAAALGLLDGDPRRIYFQPFPSAGATDLAEWQTVLAALGTLWALLKVLSESRDALDTLRAIRDRVGRGREAAEARHVQWSDRGARPGRLEALLRIRSWAPSELASLLACSTEEAEAILWSFGFTADESGLWHFAGDEAAVLISDAIETSMSEVARVGTREQLERLYRERIEAYLRTGEFPQPPWYDPDHWYWGE